METGDYMTDAARAHFGQEVAERIRQLDTVEEAVYEPIGFQVDYLRRGEASPGHVYLETTFLECRDATGEERSRRIDALASIAAAPRLPDSWDEVRPLLRPVLRGAGFGVGEAQPKELIRRPAMPYLAELVVIDTSRAMAYVHAANVDQWGVTAEDVFAAARANMTDTAMSTLDRDEQGPALIRFVDDGDCYFTSLPLIEGWLAGVGTRLGARPLAFVAERNSLLVMGIPWSGTTDLDSLLATALEEYRDAARSISPVAYTVNEDGDVIELELPDGHPSWAAVRRAQITLAVDAYRVQGDYLKAKYEDELTDVFVATLQSVRSPGGLEFTVATWSDGLVLQLPQAHYVAFYADEYGSTFLVPWQAVMEEVELTPVDGLYPPRYHVEGWPGPDAMARLEARAEMP